MPLINCEINLILTWSEDSVISSATEKTNFAMTDTELYVLAVILLTKDNTRLLEQLKFGFKRKIKWSNYQSKVSKERQNQY